MGKMDWLEPSEQRQVKKLKCMSRKQAQSIGLCEQWTLSNGDKNRVDFTAWANFLIISITTSLSKK